MARENPPSNNLWFGNLPSDATDAEVKILFEKHGKIDSITTYPSRNYGFVYFKEVEAAKSAKQALSGHVLRGNALKIEFAKPAKPCKSLWVSGISNSTSKEDLEEEFLKFGKIQEFRFLRDRSTAFVDYFTLEDASQALKGMNGKRVGGAQLRVDYLRSQSSRREQGPDAGQFPNRIMGPSDPYADHGIRGFKRPFQFLSAGSPGGDAQPSKVLRIRHPPSVVIEDDMLHNAMILFGEIERIKTFGDSNDAFVEFRSVEEARRAKEGLQGKLFNDPRILIEYSNFEFPGKGLAGEYPFQSLQMDILGLHQPGLLGNDPTRPLLPGTRGHDPYNPSSQTLVGGPNWRRSSPPLGGFSSSGLNAPGGSVSGAWDVFDAGQVHRESKRSRIDSIHALDRAENLLGLDDHHGPHMLRSGGSPSLVTRGTAGLGKRHLENDCIWRGVIAKGGNPVCHARCVPLGQGLSADIPDVVNCSARTGLDLLTKHYDDAIGFEIVFFLPDSEKDFASYTEFLRYLGSKDRAGVAKFDDGTTLFLVPPSDFLTKVLKVSGPERLYGVVLKFPQVASSSTSMNSQSIRPEYPGPHKMTAMRVGYAGAPREERILPSDNLRALSEAPQLHPKTAGPLNSSLPATSVMPTTPASQATLALTPELIATLTSLLPSSSGSHTGSLPQATSLQGAASHNAPHSIAPQVLDHSGQVVQQLAGQSNALQHLSTGQANSMFSNAANQFHQPMNMHGQMREHGTYLPPQGVVSSIAPAMSLQIPPVPLSSGNMQHYGSSPGVLRSQGMIDQGTDASKYYDSSLIQQPAYPVASSKHDLVTGVSQTQSYMLQPSVVEHTHQSQPSLAVSNEMAQESGETEDNKNERYQRTLLFAANLLSRIQQPSGNPSGDGAGSR